MEPCIAKSMCGQFYAFRLFSQPSDQPASMDKSMQLALIHQLYNCSLENLAKQPSNHICQALNNSYLPTVISLTIDKHLLNANYIVTWIMDPKKQFNFDGWESLLSNKQPGSAEAFRREALPLQAALSSFCLASCSSKEPPQQVAQLPVGTQQQSPVISCQ